MGRADSLRFEFRVLGPFEVAAGGHVLSIASLKQQGLLALLVTNLNRPVSIDAIGEALWAGDPPSSLTATVQSLIYRLRKSLAEVGAEAAGVGLGARPSGYVLEGEQLQVDAHRFERLALRGRELAAADAHDAAARAFGDGLALWRGRAYDGLDDLTFARLEATRLEQARLLAIEGLAEAELTRGRADEALRLLEPHVAANPLREAAWGQLMVTLYRLGRQAEALRAYQELRRLLREELGLEPNPALRQLEAQILAHSPELGRPTRPTIVSTPSADSSVVDPVSLPTPPPEGPTEGSLTIVMFTDVEGSTDLRTRCGDEIAQKLLRDHGDVVRRLVVEHGGREIKALGDGFLTTFSSARRALTCAGAIQQAFGPRGDNSSEQAIHVRIGVNAGEVIEEDGDVFGQAVHAAARVAAKARGGQVLVSELVRRLVGTVPGLEFRDAGRFRLKGFPERWRLFELVWADAGQAESRTLTGRTPLVGRDAELTEMRTALDGALSGSGTVVMLAGEPGIGKTRLTEELSAEALRRRALVFVGRCLEAEGAPPYGPFVEILESALAQASTPEAFLAVAGDAAPEIARLVPRLRRLFPDLEPALSLPPELERRYLFNSVAEMLGRSGRAIPTILVLEDLHWADEATLLLLDHLVRNLAEASVMIIGTYRDVELNSRPALARTLDGLVRQRLVRQIHLNRLSVNALAEMLGNLAGQEPPETIVELLFKETEGNPFFIEELFRYLTEDGRLLDAAGHFRRDVSLGSLDVPENVRLVVGRRLDRLSENTQQVLGVAAVIGRSFRYDVLEAAVTNADDAVLDAIDEAERAHLVIATPGQAAGEDFGFVHELVRQTLLARLPAVRRRKVHVTVAEAMERVLGHAIHEYAADVAHHLVEAGTAAELQTTERWLTVAGRRAMEMSAFEDALRAFEQAIDLGTADSARRAALLVDLARAQRSVGRWDEYAVTTWTALEAYEAIGDRGAVARISADASWAVAWLARFSEARGVAERGLAAVADQDIADRGYLLATLGATTALTGDYEVGDALINEAAELAEHLHDDRLSAHVAEHRMHVAWCHLHHSRAVEEGRRAADAHGSLGDLFDRAMNLSFVAFGLAQLGRFDEVDDVRAELEPLARRLGCYPALCLSHRAGLVTRLCRTGDLAGLTKDAERDYEINNAGGLAAWNGQAHTWRAMALFWQGDWAGARPDFEKGMHLEPDGPFQGWGSSWVFWHRAYMGERDEALALLETWRDDLPQAGQPASWGAWMRLAAAVEGLTILSEFKEAATFQAVVEGALEQGAVGVNYHDARLVQRVAGIAAAAGHQWAAATEHFEAALRLADELPHRIEALETRRFYGHMLLDRAAPGDHDRAVTLLTEAVIGYRRLGMIRHAELAAQMLSQV